jgi:hypothetical protein
MLSHQVPETGGPLESVDDRKTVATNRAVFGDICELWALFAFTVAEPVYSRLVNRPMYLERQIDSSLWLLIGLLSFVGPVLLAAASVGLASLSRRLYRIWHVAGWSVMAGLLVLLAFRYSTLRLPFFVAAAAAVCLTTVLVVVRQRVASIGSLLRVASLGTLIFPVVFAVEVFGKGDDSRPAAAATEVRRPTPVVLVIFDEFCGVTLMDANRAVNAARFPGFAELGTTATWYRNATSVHPRTDHAVPAILSGKFPDRAAEPLAREYPQNLFSLLLRGRTYSPVVFEPYTRLYPIAEMKGVKSETVYHDTTASFLELLPMAYLQEVLPDDQPLIDIDLPLAWFNLRNPVEEWNRRGGLIMHMWDSDRLWQVDQFLECIAPRRLPGLYFAHFCLPHYPWCYLPSGRHYEADEGIFATTQIPGALGDLQEVWGPDELATDQACARSILQAQFADRQVARLIARLKETGLFDECLLIVVADHGVSFRPNHSRRLAAADSLADIMSVPLFVKLPKQTAGSISDRNVETIDVLPTIADVLGIDLAEPVDGVSFLDPASPEKPIKRFCNEQDVTEVDAVFEEKYAVLAHMLGKFGGGRSPERMYRLGPHSELIGRPAEELRIGPTSSWKPVVDSPRSFRVEGDFIPCHLTGRVKGPNETPPRPVALAVAVNGIIRGTTRTYTTPECRDRWSLLLPEEDFRPGENEVEVMLIPDGVGGAISH